MRGALGTFWIAASEIRYSKVKMRLTGYSSVGSADLIVLDKMYSTKLNVGPSIRLIEASISEI